MNVKGNNVATVKSQNTLNALVENVNIKDRFERMLGKKTAGFLSSVISLANNNKLLKEAEPKSVLAAAAIAASLDLPINPSLGRAYIVPYRNKMGAQIAQFQIGYKGIIDLALRSGQMRSIVAVPVCRGEIREWNKFDERITLGAKESDEVIGFYAMFELTNGFHKAVYWTKDEVIRHALRFNKSCQKAGKLADIWASDFDAMAKKTVLMSILRNYAPLSIEMQNAMTNDSVAFDRDGEASESVDTEFITAEVVEETEENENVQAAPGQTSERQIAQPVEQEQEQEGQPSNGADIF